jgi:hypothetical protein
MSTNTIIKCIITGTAFASENKICVEVREYANDDVVFNLDLSNFILHIDARYRRIKECTFNEYNGQYELTPFINFSDATFVVVALYDTIEVVHFAKVGSNHYKGTSSAIYVKE